MVCNDWRPEFIMPIYRSLMGVSRGRVFTGALTSGGTIATGANTYGVCTSSDSRFVYSTGDNLLSMYSRNTSTSSLTSIGSINVSSVGGQRFMCVSPDGTSLYVTCSNSQSYGNRIQSYSRNISTGQLTYTGFVSVSGPISICISSDGTSVYSSVTGNLVGVFTRNISTGILTANGTIAAVNNVFAVAISPNGANVYATNTNLNVISMYSRNTSTGALTSIGTVNTGNNPQGICISPDGINVYAGTYGDNTISRLSRNTSTGILTAINSYPSVWVTNLCVSSDGKSLYAANYYPDNTVSLFTINTSTGALTSGGTLATGTRPYGICISPDGGGVYTANSFSSNISIFNRS